MVLVSVGLLTGRGVYHLVQRGILKKGDKGKATATQTDDQEAGIMSYEFPSQKAHILHQQHPLSFEDGGDEFLCNACLKRGSPGGGRYCCKDCDFNLHLACATSEEMWDLSGHILTDFKTSAHKHPMKLEMTEMSSSDNKFSKFTCSHCHNKGYSLLKYQCEEECHSQMHFVCAVSPTMLLSFLHPDHVLELKTRHHFKNCAVCNHGGKLNARVYICEECDFFVHPDCAQRRQYFHFPLHRQEEGHTLVYRELADDGQNQQASKAICKACDRECTHWSYTCYVCQGVHFHRECIVNYYYPHYPSKIENYGLKSARKEGLIHVGLEATVVLGKMAITLL